MRGPGGDGVADCGKRTSPRQISRIARTARSALPPAGSSALRGVPRASPDIRKSNIGRQVEATPDWNEALEEGWLLTRGGGYVLQVEPEQLDADRFERPLSHASEELACGDAAVARARLHDALALWRGSPTSRTSPEMRSTGSKSRA
jgi:hypothetical protein